MSDDVTGHPDGVPGPRSSPSGPPAAGVAAATVRRLLELSKERGFLGPGPVQAHLDHSALMVRLCGGADSVLDLGSGGGVPGLLLAAELPDVRVVLLDSMAKRCEFLREVLPQVSERAEVVEGRAEALARRPDLRAAFAVVTARSFGPPAVTAECAVGFLREDGRLMVSEPPGGLASRWDAAGLTDLGLTGLETVSDGVATVAVLARSGPLGDQWPRRDGLPSKRPLWAVS